MRHLKSGYHLNRTASHRKAMLSNLSAALFERKRIKTTLAKAKAARSVAERFITMAKKGDLASRRHVLRFIPQKQIVKILFEEIAPMYADRPGGYSRIVKLGQRHGDGAPLAILELVGFETVVQTKKTAKKKAEKDKEEETAKAKPARGKKKAEKAPEEETVEAAVGEKKPKKTRKKAAKDAKEEVVKPEPEVEVTEEAEVEEKVEAETEVAEEPVVEPEEVTEEAAAEEEAPPEEPEEEDEDTKKEE